MNLPVDYLFADYAHAMSRARAHGPPHVLGPSEPSPGTLEGPCVRPRHMARRYAINRQSGLKVMLIFLALSLSLSLSLHTYTRVCYQ